MVAQFPPQASNIDPWLIPNLDVVLDIEDVTTSEADPLEPGEIIGSSTSRSSRVVKIEITASGIKITLIKNAVTRLFAYIKEAVDKDINITPPAQAALPLNPYAQPTNIPQIKINVNVDRSKSEKTVNLELKILKLKASSLSMTFERLLIYINEVVETDMNPSI